MHTKYVCVLLLIARESESKQENFMECEIVVAVVGVELILEETEALLFGGQSTGVTNKGKSVDWHSCSKHHRP